MKLFATELRSFPDPALALSEGIVDMSDDLRVERLLEAYSFGIFPWPHEDLPTLWYCPEQRGVLDFSDFHVPRSLRKLMGKCDFTYSFDRAFDDVISACAFSPRPHQRGTWITKKLLRAYREFHRAGYAHSLEVWQAGELVGGLYGVYVGGAFSGESMFHRRPNASKLALVRLVEFLRVRGLQWMDIQMVTPLSEQFGGRYVPRLDFLHRLDAAKTAAREIDFQSWDGLT